MSTCLLLSLDRVRHRVPPRTSKFRCCCFIQENCYRQLLVLQTWALGFKILVLWPYLWNWTSPNRLSFLRGNGTTWVTEFLKQMNEISNVSDTTARILLRKRETRNNREEVLMELSMHGRTYGRYCFTRKNEMAKMRSASLKTARGKCKTWK